MSPESLLRGHSRQTAQFLVSRVVPDTSYAILGIYSPFSDIYISRSRSQVREQLIFGLCKARLASFKNNGLSVLEFLFGLELSRLIAGYRLLELYDRNGRATDRVRLAGESIVLASHTVGHILKLFPIAKYIPMDMIMGAADTYGTRGSWDDVKKTAVIVKGAEGLNKTVELVLRFHKPKTVKGVIAVSLLRATIKSGRAYSVEIINSREIAKAVQSAEEEFFQHYLEKVTGKATDLIMDAYKAKRLHEEFDSLKDISFPATRRDPIVATTTVERLRSLEPRFSFPRSDLFQQATWIRDKIKWEMYGMEAKESGSNFFQFPLSMSDYQIASSNALEAYAATRSE